MTLVRLDFVSPLPPARSGIADYAVDLLPHLAAAADVRVIRLPSVDVRADVIERFAPAPFSALGSDGRLALYQMGNNELHAEIEGAARRMPGIVTLHDVGLHHLLLGETLGKGDFDGYVERLRRDHGWIGDAVARGFGWGFFGDAAQFALLANRSLLAAQRGVLVHGRWAADLLAEEMPGLPVRVVPMAIPLPAKGSERGAESGRELRRRLGISPSAPVLGSVGFQTPIKRTDVVIRALAAAELRQVHLVIAGEAAERLDFVELARQSGVANRVHVLGYVSFSDLEAVIAASDLCVNLRYPTAGETSASLLRILAQGKPAVVSDFAQFRDLPETIVTRVPLGEPADEVGAFGAAVAALLRQPEALLRMGEAARRHVAAVHDPAAAGRSIAEACADFLATSPTPAAAGWPRREGSGGEAIEPPPSSWVWTPLAASIEVEGLEPVWPEGERRRLVVRLRNPGPARWRRAGAGEGGLAVAVRLYDAGGRDLFAGRPWRPLERDVEPGETAEFAWFVRRPLGDARLRVEPQVLGRGTLEQVGGPAWEAAI